MRFCRVSAVIMAFTAIELHGAVNVTASREYVDRKLTSVSNSIMDEVSSNLRKIASDIASATNGLLSTESDPMFIAWTNGTATLSGSFVQGSGFKNALVNNPILASGARAHAQGYATRAYGDNSHAEGTSTVASNMNSHAEGEYTKALGRGSHAEGYFAVASNDYSHAEGDHTVAGGILSHAGGSYSRAWGDTSRAWGIGATANAAMSVSEGNQTQANGWYSTARGYWTAANGVMSHAEGVNATAEGNPIFSPEDVSDFSDLLATYTWSAVYKGEDTNSNYRSHGPGTYNINPSGGLAGFYVGETNLQMHLQAAISAANPAFSNEVLSVGLNIDTNSIAVLNGIAETFGGFPLEGTATTIGGLLTALAAAIAWLKRNKADKADVDALKENKANSADLPYALVSATINNGAYELADRAVNKVTVDDSVSYLTFIFPKKTEGKMRDFFIRLIITGETIPTISFVEPNGDAVSFDVDDDSWAEIEQGVNILMFTDTAE